MEIDIIRQTIDKIMASKNNKIFDNSFEKCSNECLLKLLKIEADFVKNVKNNDFEIGKKWSNFRKSVSKTAKLAIKGTLERVFLLMLNNAKIILK